MPSRPNSALTICPCRSCTLIWAARWPAGFWLRASPISPSFQPVSASCNPASKSSSDGSVEVFSLSGRLQTEVPLAHRTHARATTPWLLFTSNKGDHPIVVEVNIEDFLITPTEHLSFSHPWGDATNHSRVICCDHAVLTILATFTF